MWLLSKVVRLAGYSYFLEIDVTIKTFESYSLEQFMYDHEDELMRRWDEYKYDHYLSVFHYDDVDWFREDLYADMCAEFYEDYLDEKK